MPTRRRFFQAIALLSAFVIILGGILIYRRISSRVNFAGFMARGAPTPISVPAGFEAGIFAEGLIGPRFMQFGPDGKLYVAERGADRIMVLEDRDGDGKSDMRRAFAEDIPNPHSIVYHRGAWYVGVPSGIIRLTDGDGDGRADEQVVLIDDYPTSNHSTRTIEFLPDGRMVVSVGSSCNVCVESDPRRASILVYEDASARGERQYASGLRNAVGLTVHPTTGELWATNNGRDHMGDDLPPETVYGIQEHADYGWPRCHSGNLPDPEYGSEGACEDVEVPIVEMQAHSAPLGLVFYSGTGFPEPYRDDLFIAFHGSWNRSVPTGYKIVRLPFEEGEPGSHVVDFATGWLADDLESVSGRPVGLAVGPDGALYVSDDSGGFIYRIAYSKDEGDSLGQEAAEIQISSTGDPGGGQASATVGPEASGEQPEEDQMPSKANVLAVNVTGGANAYQFSVQVGSPDAGCDQYSDWWEVVSEAGELIYRRTLLHSHTNEQPFTRSGGPVAVGSEEVVVVRAHMHPDGYGGKALKGSIAEGFVEWEPHAEFAPGLEHEPPQPPDCGF